ncbi:exopolysaccharide biosynthesis polyprenyl glycosylphosphotransferase [Sphingobium sufflavum]|uniref:exopolysaccharide biosynthesis polyprenyl glycosylphosphotransferase n=1 Tax=Sphingobium sufflavum TaxID=1129547 RepID=UPI001F3F072C|nr:exopolysaccharide biosynthesis polyprenyl glycosylphosphotransferase [Sphingobium sufflavum]MCE7797300.1 exopolysaccharide biosynthesis polyprenyl glycosylphosphotransferase [Sphingobium sufflavum]
MSGPKAYSREAARFRLYILSIMVDIAVLAVAFALANYLVLGNFQGQPGKPHGLVMFAMIAPVYILLAVHGGVYGFHAIGRRRQTAWKALFALGQAAMLMLLIVYFGKIAERLSRLTFAVGLFLGAGGLVWARGLADSMARAVVGETPHLTVLIEDGEPFDASSLAEVVDVVDARAAGLDPTCHDAATAARLAALVGTAERVVVSCAADRVDAWGIALASLSAKAEILLPELRRLAPAKIGAFEDHPTIVVASGPLAFRDRLLKRLLDIVLSAAAIILLSPVLIVAAIAVRVSGAGPILFRQARLGRDAAPFMILKFRTMHHGMADAAANQLTQKNDPRVTRIGDILRRTSIDELPQLFNVLIGDMSIVGPRPHAPAAKAADSLYWEVDHRYWARHCIKPGMTGLAQVRGHRGPTDKHEDLVNRLQSDLEYVTNWSIWRDLGIIAATLRVLAHDNAF